MSIVIIFCHLIIFELILTIYKNIGEKYLSEIITDFFYLTSMFFDFLFCKFLQHHQLSDLINKILIYKKKLLFEYVKKENGTVI